MIQKKNIIIIMHKPMPGSIVLWIFLIVGIIIILVFWSVYRKSRDGSRHISNPEKIRLVIFLGIALISAIYTIFTLPKNPYFSYAEKLPDKVILVEARMFNWNLSGPVDDIRPGDVVEFRVTSSDVNHGFGLYNPEGIIIAQVQAMPGYENRLRVRFEKPGNYTILCMEYCGAAHSYMSGKISVR